MPLAMGRCSSREAARRIEAAGARKLFPEALHPEAALAGLWLYFSCLEESHRVSQGLSSPEGSFWHGVMHRQEPDAANSAYWFRRAGRHPVFEPLLREAETLAAASPGVAFPMRESWDPFLFIEFCESARRKPGSAAEKLALEIQRAEWQLLFDHCARPKR